MSETLRLISVEVKQIQPSPPHESVLRGIVLGQLSAIATENATNANADKTYPRNPEEIAKDRAATANNAIELCQMPYNGGKLKSISLTDKKGGDALNNPLCLSLDGSSNPPSMSWVPESNAGRWRILQITAPDANGRVTCTIGDDVGGGKGTTRVINLESKVVQAALIQSVSTNDLATDPVLKRLSPEQKILYEANRQVNTGHPDTEMTLPGGAKKKAHEILTDKTFLIERAKETGIVTGEAVHAKVDAYLNAEYLKLGIKNLASPVEPAKFTQVEPVDPKLDAVTYAALTPTEKGTADTKYASDMTTYKTAKTAHDTATTTYQAEKAAYDADQKKLDVAKSSGEYARLQRIEQIKSSIAKDGIPTGDQLGTLTHLIRLPEIQASFAQLKTERDSIIGKINALPQGEHRDRLSAQLKKISETEEIQNELIKNNQERMRRHFGLLQGGLTDPTVGTGRALAEMFTPGGDIAALTTEIDVADTEEIEKKLNPLDTSYWGFFKEFLKNNKDKAKVLGGLAFFLLNLIYSASLKARAH